MHKSGQDAEIRVRVRRNPRKFFRKLVLVIITLYVAFLAYGFVHNMVITRLAKVEQIQEGTVESTVSAKALVVRSEKVVPAPRGGTLRVIASEGERVRVGQVVAQVVSASLDSKTGDKPFNIVSPRAGIVSYRLDGLEEVLSPQNLKELDLNKIDTIKSETRTFSAGAGVEEGKPVLKIINNLDPVTLLAVTEVPVTVEKGKKTLLVSFNPPGDDASSALVIDARFRGKANQMALSLSKYGNNLMTERRVDFRIITDRYKGFVVRQGSIVRKDGKDGIYTVYKERVKWKGVEIKGKAQGKAVISGVTPDIKVILNPEYVKEGTPFKLP